ncbi:MAG: NUDIX domain-containing protein [Proteobacteria bacterium]|nr:NUDIX domain-containing protein [Verrucomicrobiota bacterium]NBU07891.1 NUDIX domain-containing protein [Pseudomonadota bacterium]
MSDEIFDVVDDRDRVIGRQTRREVHARGLKHRAVHVLVFNPRGEVFLQKRSFKKDSFPGAWDSSASGHLDSGETYDACSVREAREEIGLVLERTPKRLFKIDACAQTGQEFVWVYRVESSGPFRLNLDELECGAFFKADHINRWMAERPRDFADSFRLVWQYYLNPPPPKAKPTLAVKATPVKLAKPSPKPTPRKPKTNPPAKAKVAKQAKTSARPSAKPSAKKPAAKKHQAKPAKPPVKAVKAGKRIVKR